MSTWNGMTMEATISANTMPPNFHEGLRTITYAHIAENRMVSMVALMVMTAELPNTDEVHLVHCPGEVLQGEPVLADQCQRSGVDVRLGLEDVDHDQNERCDEQQQQNRQNDDHQCMQNLGASAGLTLHNAATSPFLPKYTCSMPTTAQTMKRTNASA